MTRGGVAMWLAIAFFPSLLMFLLRSQVRGEVPPDALAVFGAYLVPQFGCMLGLLLWATRSVGSELEAQTWSYIALRPHGRRALVLGKYLAAIVFSITSGLVSSAGVAIFSQYGQSVLIQQREEMLGSEEIAPNVDAGAIAAGELVNANLESLQFAGILSVLVVISSLGYGALYLMIGVVATRRATVIAVVYSLLVEGALSYVPAMINKSTISYRLQSLLTEWTGHSTLQAARNELLGYEPAWQHLVGAALLTVFCLITTLVVVQTKEFPGQGED